MVLPIVGGCSQLKTRSQTSTTAKQTLDMRFGLAKMTESKGSLVDARKMYRNILNENPKHVDSLHRLGVVSIKLEQLDQAIEYLNTAMELDEPSPELLGDLGYAYLLKGDPQQAESILQKAAKLDPRDKRILNNLAMAIGYQGRSDESLALFRRAADYSEAKAQSNLAFVLSATGDLDSAKDRYRLALQRDPRSKAAALGLSEFYMMEQNTQQQERAPEVAQAQFTSDGPLEIVTDVSTAKERKSVLDRIREEKQIARENPDAKTD